MNISPAVKSQLPGSQVFSLFIIPSQPLISREEIGAAVSKHAISNGRHKSSAVCLRSCLTPAFTAVARAKPTEQTTRERERERERCERERERGEEMTTFNIVRLEVGTGGAVQSSRE